MNSLLIPPKFRKFCTWCKEETTFEKTETCEYCMMAQIEQQIRLAKSKEEVK